MKFSVFFFSFSPQALGLETSESKRNSFSSDSSKAKVQTQFLWGSKQKSGTYSHPIQTLPELEICLFF